MYTGTTAPAFWLMCNGQEISREIYAVLFEIIGTTYGAGNGSTTFNVPDLRNRMPIGAGDIYALNASGGSKDMIVPYHNHSVSAFTSGTPSTNTSGTPSNNSTNTAGAHRHSLKGSVALGSSSHPALGGSYSGSTTAGDSMYDSGDHTHTLNNHTHSLGNHTHSIGAHNTNYAGTSNNVTNANLPPYRAVNFIIYVGV